MRNFLFSTLILISVFFFGRNYTAFSQCSSLTTNISIDFQVTDACAPVSVTTFSITYNFLTAQNPNDVVIRIEWDDNANSVSDFGVGTGLVVESPTRFTAVGTFTYGDDDRCLFTPTATMRLNGVECADSEQPQTVNSWNLDNLNGGIVAIEEPEKFVCEGDGFSGEVFLDATTFNCNPVQSPVGPNTQSRHVQFVYGTNHPGSPAGVADLSINDGGTVVLTDATGNLTSTTTRGSGATVTARYFGPVEEVPFPATLPISQTFPFELLPNANNVPGDFFEITMYNWNVCNPYNGDPVNPNYGDAISQTAYIRVINNPDADIRIRDNNGVDKASYCPGDEIRLRVENISGGTGNRTYLFQVFDNAAGTGPTIFESNGGAFTNEGSINNFAISTITPGISNGFSAGDKRVNLIIRDNGAIGNCETVVSEIFNITESPVAQIDYNFTEDGGASVFNGDANTSPIVETCYSPFDGTLELSSNTLDVSGNGFTLEWDLYKRRNRVDLISSTHDSISVAGPNLNVNITRPGVYKYVLTATDLVNSCFTFKEFIFIIHDDPDASFTFTDACVGDLNSFNPSGSNLSPRIDYDNINLYEWDFDYDGVTFDVDRSETNNNVINQSLGAVGTYTVALRVSTTAGCSDIVTRDVTVFPNPDAILTSDYSVPLCPGETITFTNNSTPASSYPDISSISYQLIVNEQGTGTSTYAIGGPGSSTPLSIFNNNSFSPYRDYEVRLEATSNDGCSVLSAPIDIEIKRGEDSDFSITDISNGTPYNALNNYCSPEEFEFQVDATTLGFLGDPTDQIEWVIRDDNSNVVDSKTSVQTDADFGNFVSNVFLNEYPNLSIEQYFIDLTITSDNICINPTTKSVRILPKPTGLFSIIDTTFYCDSISYRLLANQPGLPTYDWSISGISATDTLSTTISNQSAILDLVFDTPENGDGDINVTIGLQTTNSSPCTSDLETLPLTVPEKEQVNVIWTLDVSGTDDCDPVTYEVINQTAAGTFPAATTWRLKVVELDPTSPAPFLRVDSAYIDGPAGNPGFFDNVTPYDTTFDITGTAKKYEFSLEAITPTSCLFPVGSPVVKDIYPVPIADFTSAPNTGCSPRNVSFTDVSNSNGSVITSRLWSIELGSTTVMAPSVQTFPGWNYTFTNNTDSIENYQVTLQLITDEGCETSVSKTIKIYPKPQEDFFTAPTTAICADSPGVNAYTIQIDLIDSKFNANPAGTVYNINWGDGTFETTDADTLETKTYENFSGLNSETKTITITARTPEGCETVDTEVVTLNPLVNSTFFAPQEAGCTPFEATFVITSAPISGPTVNNIFRYRVKGSGTPYTTMTGPITSGQIKQVFNNSTATDLIYEVIYTKEITLNGVTCENSDTLDITVFPEVPIKTITGPTPAEVCAFEQNVTFSVPDTPGSRFIWTVPTGSFISSSPADSNTIEVSFGNQSGQVSVREINSNNCEGPIATYNMTVLKTPTGNISLAGPDVICPGDFTDLQFTLTGTDGTNSGNFDVTITDGTNDTTFTGITNGQLIPISPANSTNYFVSNVVDTDHPSCSFAPSGSSVFILLQPVPTATISRSSTICRGNDSFVFITYSGVGPWQTVMRITETESGNVRDTTFESTTAFELLTVSPTVTTDYTLVSVQDLNNSNSPQCFGTVTNNPALVTVNIPPTATISGNVNNVCLGESAQLSVDLTGVGPWTVIYSGEDSGGNSIGTFFLSNITPPGGYDPETDTYTHVFNVNAPLGTTTYTINSVRDSNSPSCEGSFAGSAMVSVYESPIGEISGSTTICQGESTPISFDLTGQAPFNVSYTNGVDTVELTNRPNTFDELITPSNSAVYRLTSLVDARGCSAFNLGLPVNINVNTPPTAVIQGSDTTCFGDAVELEFVLTGIGPWEIVYTDGSSNYTFTTSFNRHNEPVTITETTTFELVSVEDSNNPSCFGTVSGSVTKFIYPELVASFTATPLSQSLPNSTVDIVNTTTNPGNWDYFWDFGDGTTSTDQNPGSHTYATYGERVITLEVTNGLCSDQTSITIFIDAIPAIPDFTADPQEGCLPLVVNFENLTQYALESSYRWDFGDGQGVSGIENPIHVYQNPGTYTVTLSADNITNTRREIIKEEFITVYETPQASFTIPDDYRSVFSNDEVVFVNTSVGADEFIWKFGDGLESTLENPVHVYADSGVYDITIIAINSQTGCQDSFKLDAQVQVLLGGETTVPNAFTPSTGGPGSGSSNIQENDYFLPQVSGVAEFNMKVYNRWGELLFESTDKNVGWDGYYKGVLMPQGVYVYRLELVYENGQRDTKVGDITLIR